MPSYLLPKNLDNQVIQRVVVRSDFCMNMVHDFIEDLKEAIKELENSYLVFHEETEIKNYGFPIRKNKGGVTDESSFSC